MRWPKAPDEGAAYLDRDAEFRRKGDGGYTGDVQLLRRLYGRVRYVVSLESSDRKIFMSVSLLLLVGCMVIFFVVLSNTYLSDPL